MAERAGQKDLLTYLKNSQAYFGVLYIAFVAIGMLFEYQRYRVYGINIFMFADVFDFLLAPLRDYKVLVYIVLSMIIIYLLLRADGYLFRNRPRLYDRMSFGMVRKSWYPLLRSISYASLCLCYLYLSSLIIAKRTQRALLTTKTEYLTFRTNDDQIYSGYIIGRAKDNLIIYREGNVTITPLSGLKEMSRLLTVPERR